MTFDELKLNRQLLNAIADLGYQEPTEIQKKAIPVISAGNDLLGIAQTGTGKTAAYLIPLVLKLKYAQGDAPRALIIAPTHELAIQIGEHIATFTKYTDLRHTVLYGGGSIKAQMAAVEKGIDLLVATPGRLLDIYAKGILSTKTIKTLILDEADRMMDMGFMPQVNRIVEIIPQKKQKLLFSATFPAKVEQLSDDFLDFPVKIEITPQATTAETIAQELYPVPNLRTKIALLEYLLQDREAFNKVIIFARTKHNANDIAAFITRKMGAQEVRVIHANKDQNARLNAIEAFRQEDVRILVATDVAARGLDVSMVSHVINFDVPIMYEEYVHRIGRTGRAKQSGVAITFMNEAEIYHIEKIEKIINMQINRKMLPAGVEVFSTPFAEKQEIAMEIDRQKRKDNPDFQGAFHEKKAAPASKTKPKSKKSKK